MRHVLVTLIVLAAKAAVGADGLHIATDPGPHPWTHLSFQDKPGTFQFAIVSDRTGGMRPGIFEKAVETLNLLQPAFVMSIGDLIEGNTSDEAALDVQWDEFNAIIEPLNAPFFHVPGNHDVSNTAFGTQVWTRRLGRLYYHFVYRETLFLCLNSDDGGLNRIGDEQYGFVETTLREHSEVRWTFVFMHKPLWATEGADGWERVEALLAPRPHTVFTGHTHEYLTYERHGRDYVVLGTTGGGMAHAGMASGEFDHIVWVTMGGESPVVANVLLDDILDKHIRTTAKAALADPLLDGRAVSIPVIASDSPTFDQGEATITLTNPAEYPLVVRGQLEPTTQMTPSLTHVARTIPPMSEVTIPLRLHATGPTDVRSLQPLVTRWTLAYTSEATGSFEVPYVTRLTVDAALPLAAADRSFITDGNLDDWGFLPCVCLEPAQVVPSGAVRDGPADGSFRFHVMHDAERFYGAVHVTDDTVYRSERPGSRRQDYVSLRLATIGANDAPSAELTLSFAPGESSGTAAWLGKQPCPEGVEAAASRVDDGYTIEVAVPNAILGFDPKVHSAMVRVNVGVNDLDSASDGGATLWWRPEWEHAGERHMSGIFLASP